MTVPPSVLAETDDYSLLDQALANLYGYDWLVLANIRSAEFFLRRLTETGYATQDLDALRLCAGDAATVERLADEHIHVDVAPPQADTATLWQTLTDYIGSEDALAYLNFLLPRAFGIQDALAEKLTAAGVRADVVPAYRTHPDGDTHRAKIAGLLAGGGIDVILFTAPAEVANFAQLFDTNDLRDLLVDVEVICADKSTAQTAATHGLQARLFAE